MSIFFILIMAHRTPPRTAASLPPNVGSARSGYWFSRPASGVHRLPPARITAIRYQKARDERRGASTLADFAHAPDIDRVEF
jgi:hypothetical protein